MAKKRSTEVARWDPFATREAWGFPDLSHRFFDLLDAGSARWGPPLDIAEEPNRYVFSVELPGVKKEDVTVEIDQNTLTIRGEKRSEHADEGERPRHVERRYGAFSRSFTLPADATGEKIEASFSDGVLTIRVPRSEAAKPKQIAVK